MRSLTTAASFFCAARFHGEFDAIGPSYQFHARPTCTGTLFPTRESSRRECTVYCPRCGLGSGSSHPRVLAFYFYFCAVFGLLLAAVSVFSLSVAVKATREPAGAGVAACSELSERRDLLHAEIARLHAETALVEAELVQLCTERSDRTDVGVPPLLAVPRSQSPGGTADPATGMQQIAPQIAQRVPARRRGKDEMVYATHCWAPNSTFTDPSCNCLGEPAHSKLGSRRTIKILVPSWHGRCTSCRLMLQACFARAPVGAFTAACIHYRIHPLCAGRARLWTPFCSRSLLRSASDILSCCFRTASSPTSGPISASRGDVAQSC